MQEKEPDKELSIQKNMIYNSVGNLIYGISQWALVAIATIVAGFSCAGILTFATSIVTVIYTVALYGMRVFQATDVSYKFKDQDYAISRFSTVIISIIICILYLFIKRYDRTESAVVIAYMLYKCAEAVCDAFHGMLQRKKRLDIVGISVTIRAILITLSFTVILILGYSLFVACISMAIATMVVFLFYDFPNVISICKMKFTINVEHQLKLLKICFPLMLASLINNAVIAIPKISLKELTSDATLGIFSTLSVPTLFITSMAAYLLAPIAVEFGECVKNSDKTRFMNLIKKATLAIIGVTIIATLCAYFLGDFGLKLIYRNDMGEYVPQFTVLMVISGMYAFITLMGSVFTTLRWLYFMFIMHALVLVITYLISPVLISWKGLWGAVYVTGLSSLIYLVINLIGILLVRRKFKHEKS